MENNAIDKTESKRVGEIIKTERKNTLNIQLNIFADRTRVKNV